MGQGWADRAAGGPAAPEGEFEGMAARARAGDMAERERLIAACRTFVARVASRQAGRFLDWDNDDELSVALIAFNEAIDLYEPGKGAGFLGFARLVIRRRLVDHFRREGRRRSASLDAAEDVVDGAVVHLSHLEMVRREEAEARAEELRELAAELSRFGISLKDLYESAPTRADARGNLAAAAAVLVGDPVLRERFFTGCQVPVKELARRLGFNRKTLERGRKYLIALAIILGRDLLFLKEYLKPLLGRQVGW